MTEWKQVRFERDALYAEVWSRPVTEVAAGHGISDNGLRRVCAAMDIPVPSVGFWAKRAAGLAVQVPPLPENTERNVFISNVPVRGGNPYSKPEDAEWLRQRLAYESTPEAAVRFDPSPQRLHPVLRELAKSLRAAAADYAKEAKRREAEKAAPKRRTQNQRREPNYEALRWINFDGGFLVAPHRSHALRVTWLTCERALAIADAIVRAAVQRGCSIEMDRDDARIILSLDAGSLSISIRERQDRGEKGPVPTDKLAIVTEGLLSGLSDIVDAPDQPAQDRIAEVFPRLYRTVVKAREADRRRATEKEEKTKSEAQAAAAAEALAEQRRIEAEERAQHEDLTAEAARWHQATQIRAYIAYLDAAGPADAEWRSWALKVADEMDPTVGRLQRVETPPLKTPAP